MHHDPEDDYQRLPSERHSDLPKYTRDFLDGLRPAEVESMRLLVALGPDEVRKLLSFLNLIDSMMTSGRFLKWVAIFCIGAFLSATTLAEKIMQMVSWFTHTGAPR
jgi:hypothetical protein